MIILSAGTPARRREAYASPTIWTLDAIKRVCMRVGEVVCERDNAGDARLPGMHEVPRLIRASLQRGSLATAEHEPRAIGRGGANGRQRSHRVRFWESCLFWFWESCLRSFEIIRSFYESSEGASAEVIISGWISREARRARRPCELPGAAPPPWP